MEAFYPQKTERFHELQCNVAFYRIFVLLSIWAHIFFMLHLINWAHILFCFFFLCGSNFKYWCQRYHIHVFFHCNNVNWNHCSKRWPKQSNINQKKTLHFKPPDSFSPTGADPNCCPSLGDPGSYYWEVNGPCQCLLLSFSRLYRPIPAPAAHPCPWSNPHTSPGHTPLGLLALFISCPSLCWPQISFSFLCLFFLPVYTISTCLMYIVPFAVPKMSIFVSRWFVCISFHSTSFFYTNFLSCSFGFFSPHLSWLPFPPPCTTLVPPLQIH